MNPLRLALRKLLQKPSFSLLAAGTLAVGLGANAAIFAIVDAVLLRPLPYAGAERLVAIEHAAPGLELPRMNMSGKLYVYYREHAESFVDIGLYDGDQLAVSGLERPIQLDGSRLTPSVLEILGARPALGRGFLEAEGAPGGAPVAIVSDSFWRQHLGGDPQVLERTLTIDGVSRQVVGVMPPGFGFPDPEVELWVPQVIDPAQEPLGSFGRSGIARLKDGVSLEQARADLQRFAGNLPALFPDENAARVLGKADFTAGVRPLRDAVVGDVGPLLWVLLATVGFVLLLACFNVANLFLARAEERQRETAIRTALGATRGTLALAGLAEGLVLAGAGAVVGVGLGALALRLLLRLAPGRLPRVEEIGIDPRTLAVVVVLALISGVVFGLIPALRGRSGELVTRLKDGGRSATAGRERHHARRALVAAQMTIAVMLLVGAGLMVRSFQHLAAVDPGFRADGGISFRLSLPGGKAAHDADAARFYDQLLERLRALPGVEAAAAGSILPLTGRDSGSGHRLKDLFESGGNEMPIVFQMQQVSPDYFRTLGIPLLEGRGLERADFEDRSGAVVINKTLAERYWPGQSALGKQLFPGTPEAGGRWYEVVGVAGDTRVQNLSEEPAPTVYYPWLGLGEDDWVVRGQSVVLRAQGDPRALIDAVRATVWELDPELPIAEVATLTELVERARSRMAFSALMLLLAAAIALVLGAVGTYGVVSYLVAQRRAEIGVRMALGAQRTDVVGMVLREGLVLAVAGVVVGLVGAAALTRSLAAVLYGVDPHDPLTFALVPLVLIAAVALACWVPARRAAGIDPVVALRCE